MYVFQEKTGPSGSSIPEDANLYSISNCDDDKVVSADKGTGAGAGGGSAYRVSKTVFGK